MAAIFAVSVFGAAFASDNVPLSWQTFDTSSITVLDKPKTTQLKLTADNIVPDRPSVLAGYCWFYTSGPYTGLCATNHRLDIGDGDAARDVRDSTQNPDGWHLHNIKTGAVTAGGHLCVTDLSDAPNGAVITDDYVVGVNVRDSVLKGTFNGHAASATIVVDGGCTPTIGAVPSALTLALDVHTNSSP